MEPQFISQHEAIEEEEETIINKLKQSISLTNTEMHFLISNQDAFVQKITKYNNLAKQKINQKTQLHISQALIYLTEAEKILQYAADCGKNINRQLIVSVLHNQACVYQILWELDQCSNYLQALIFNYQRFIKQSTQLSLPPSYINFGSHINFNGDSQINFEAQKMFGFAGGSEISYMSKLRDPHSIGRLELKLLNYYFEHCAVSSQLQRNNKGLQSAKKGIKLLRISLRQRRSLFFEEMRGYKVYNREQDMQMKYSLLERLSEMSEKINLGECKQIVKAAHFSIKMWNNNCKVNQTNQLQIGAQSIKIKGESMNDRIGQKVKNLAIGTIMQILPKQFNKITNQAFLDDQQNSIFSLPEFLLRVFFLSVGYFSVATQLRLLSNAMFKNQSEQNKKNSDQYQQSMIYHLIAIIIGTIYIPYQCKYIQDILNSYSRHYSNNLQDYKPIQSESILKISQLLKLNHSLNSDFNQINKSTKQSKSQSIPHQYPINLNTLHINQNNSKKNIQSTEKLPQKLKTLHYQIQTPKTKKSRAQSKTSKMKRSISKQSLNIQDKIQTKQDKIQIKYNQLKKILSADNLNILEQGPKSPIKKLKKPQKQKIQYLSNEKIPMTKKTSEKQKDNLKVKQKPDGKKPKIQKQKTQRKTKNSQKKEQQKTPKVNNFTQQDEQFFFYMTKKTTKSNTNQNGNMFSPKQSIRSIGSSRRSTSKKSVCSSRSNSKNSPRMGNIQSSSINSTVTKGFLNIKKMNSQKKNTKVIVQGSLSANRNYF